MSELCMSNTTKKSQFSGHIISDFLMLFYFILSHPLYFSYFVFFSPYLLKLLSFLSPLFVTTSLLLVAFLTLSPSLANETSSSELPESKTGFLAYVYNILEKLSSEADNETEQFNEFEEFELFKIVFDVSMYEVKGRLDDEEKCIEAIESTVICIDECLDDQVSELSCEEKCIEPIEGTVDENSRGSDENLQAVFQPFGEAMMLKDFRLEKSNFDYVLCNKDEKEIKPASAEFAKVEERAENNSISSESETLKSKVSEVISKASYGNDEELNFENGEDSHDEQEAYLQKSDRVENYTSKVGKESPRRSGANLGLHVNDEEFDDKVNGSFSPNLSSFGSMRIEKEWRRTLACKLFEERHNVDGSGGMDSLWETYESKESMKVKTKGNAKKSKSYHDDEDDEDEDEYVDGKLCCLQALKFSTGKMNLGMGRPNLVKISKAFKGIGWLQSMSKRGKKS